MKTLLAFLFFITAHVLSTDISPAVAEQNTPLEETKHNPDNIVHFILRNTDFKEPDRQMAIPAALFMDGIMPQEGGVDSGILLEVHWPDFSGHVADLAKNAVRILVTTKKPTFSEEQVMKNMLQLIVMSDDQDLSDVFTSNIPVKLVPPQPIPGQVIPSDIMQLANQLNSSMANNHTQIYIDKAPYPSRIISCEALNNKTEFSSCSDTFYYKNLTFKVSYDRPYVAEWKKIEETVKNNFDIYMR
ncbi:hypothetical protein [Acetobacter thailandicus]|uniref:hypothetical protein n=1 Tax=Acetobacter thailandicus TaxID=1502842 RepID=UPI001BA451BF|nr:hypothetical protein [Acetobacter thailandicus]MBS0986489.1 hypothetical protein [Acetobacter thailandicus]